MEYPRQIAQDLRKNFCAEVMYRAAGRCRELALDSTNPAPFFVLETVLARVGEGWERALTVEEAEETKLRVGEPIFRLLDALGGDPSDAEVLSLCNMVVAAYLSIVPRSTR